MKAIILFLSLVSTAIGQDYFVLSPTDKRIKPQYISATKVRGYSIRFSWAAVEPRQGQFNWSAVDAEINKAKSFGKQVMLRPMAGIRAPTWLYSVGAQSVTEGGARAPLPWDNVMLTNWERFVAEMGRKYNSDSSIVLTHMSGPTFKNAEMHLPKSLLSMNPNAKALTYGAWQRSIRAYAVAFPNKFSCLNLSNPYGDNDGLLESVSSYAMLMLGSRCSLQNNSLSHRTSLTFAPVQIISAYGGQKGFQLFYEKRTRTTLMQAVQIGQQAGARYYEIYPPDVGILP